MNSCRHLRTTILKAITLNFVLYKTTDMYLLSKDDFKGVEESIKNMSDVVTKLSPRPEHIILNNKDIAELLKVSSKTVQKWRDNGLISYSKVGREIFYKLSDVLEFLDDHKIEKVSTQIQHRRVRSR